MYTQGYCDNSTQLLVSISMHAIVAISGKGRYPGQRDNSTLAKTTALFLKVDTNIEQLKNTFEMVTQCLLTSRLCVGTLVLQC